MWLPLLRPAPFPRAHGNTILTIVKAQGVRNPGPTRRNTHDWRSDSLSLQESIRAQHDGLPHRFETVRIDPTAPLNIMYDPDLKA